MVRKHVLHELYCVMNIIRNPEQLETRETYADAVRRHRNRLKSTLKGRPLKLTSRFMAAADVQRGLVAPPA
jgi:hypothetical protein